MLDKESVKRVLDTFEAHSLFINKKYEAYKSKDNYWSSDRDRLLAGSSKSIGASSLS